MSGERREVIREQYVDGDREWVIEIHDDQPIAEGKEYAADSRVVVLLNGERLREFTYPGYRIWTLLAHWTEGLDGLLPAAARPADPSRTAVVGHERAGVHASLGTEPGRNISARLGVQADPAREFDALAPTPEIHGLLNVVFAAYLRAATGLPIDFAIQRQTQASEHKGIRNPMGSRPISAVGDAPAEVFNGTPSEAFGLDQNTELLTTWDRGIARIEESER